VESFPTLLGERLARTDLAEQQRNALQTAMAQATAARQRPINEMIFAFDNYVTSAAQLYETVAASSGSVKSMRDGLYISNPGALGRFNKLVDEVNRAHEVADSALRRLAPEQQTRFRRMGLATPIRK